MLITRKDHNYYDLLHTWITYAPGLNHPEKKNYVTTIIQLQLPVLFEY